MRSLVDGIHRFQAGVFGAQRDIFRRLVQGREPDHIVGAICVSVLIGLAWAKISPGSFGFPADTAWATPGLLRYSYFSFVTLATLGYGDVTPVTALGGTLAWMEAITGQLYLAITVARPAALSMADSSDPDTASRA